MIEEIVCGGQTGVDLAAAQAALDTGIKQGGFCPHGRTNEDGVIPARFNFVPINMEPLYTNERKQQNIDERTKTNIKHSDGTLIIVFEKKDLDEIKDGTRLTNIDVDQQKNLHCASRYLTKMKKIQQKFVKKIQQKLLLG